MTRRRVLFAHERPSIARAVGRVLQLHGFDLDIARSRVEAQRALDKHRYDALVIDVALEDSAGYELAGTAKHLASTTTDRGAPVVVLVASVYRRTSYKRRPTRLYGADDYVEIHHLGDALPRKLLALCGDPPATLPDAIGEAQGEVKAVLQAEGDSRLGQQGQRDPAGLASLIVADMVLYNGDAIVAADDLASAEAAVGDDLEIARELYAAVLEAEGQDRPSGDPVGDAFRELMRVMGRAEGVA